MLSSSWSIPARSVRPQPLQPNCGDAARAARSRRLRVATHAWLGAQRPAPQLWGYDGSCVKRLGLGELQLLHRLSFGHRNQRSYLVIVYDPASPACAAFEAEVERLASGLAHEQGFVAAALDASDPAAATFARIMLGISSVPAVLLYPEAARGCLKFLGPDMSAPGMLAAINKARQKALPGGGGSPGAASWHLQEAVAPLSLTGVRAAAASARAGDAEALLSAVRQQMQPLQRTPLLAEPQGAGSIWTQGRVAFWLGMAAVSLLFVAWDVKLADAWEDFCLRRRQAARARGKSFSLQENADDLVALLMHKTGLGGGDGSMAAVAAALEAQQQSQSQPQLAGQQPLQQPLQQEQQEQQQQQQQQQPHQGSQLQSPERPAGSRGAGGSDHQQQRGGSAQRTTQPPGS